MSPLKPIYSPIRFSTRQPRAAPPTKIQVKAKKTGQEPAEPAEPRYIIPHPENATKEPFPRKPVGESISLPKPMTIPRKSVMEAKPNQKTMDIPRKSIEIPKASTERAKPSLKPLEIPGKPAAGFIPEPTTKRNNYQTGQCTSAKQPKQLEGGVKIKTPKGTKDANKRLKRGGCVVM